MKIHIETRDFLKTLLDHDMEESQAKSILYDLIMVANGEQVERFTEPEREPVRFREPEMEPDDGEEEDAEDGAGGEDDRAARAEKFEAQSKARLRKPVRMNFGDFGGAEPAFGPK